MSSHVFSTQRNSQYTTAILGMWWGWNYGALLTSFALYKIVEKLGYAPFLIDHAPMSETWEHCTSKNTPFRRFLVKEYVSTLPIKSERAAKKLNSQFNNFVVGSDQLWRHQYIHEFGTQFFLDFVESGKRKIAYATSMGDTGANVPADFRSIATQLLKHFDAISLREFSGVSELARLYKTHGVQAIDPVFLPATDFWKNLASKAAAPAKVYTLSYILDTNHQIDKLEKHVRQALATKQVLITDYEKPLSATDALQYDTILNQITPTEWLSSFANCDFLVTDSFHGACFAIIFNRPFICLINNRRGETRFHTLQQLFPTIAHRFITTPENLPADFTTQDFSEVNSILHSERVRCISWLAKSLQCHPKHHDNIQGIPPCRKPGRLRVILHKIKQYIINRLKGNNKTQRSN